MKTTKTFLVVASAVLALSTALSAGAEPSTPDAQAQAGVLLTARSRFHTAQPVMRAGTDADAQSQARAIVSGEGSRKAARMVADNGMTPQPARPSTQLAHRGPHKHADAQSMAATVLLGRSA
jgi:hypothetical protein